MHALYRLLYHHYENQNLATWLGLPPTSAEFCQSQQSETGGGGADEKCGRPDLFAFQCISALTFWICGPMAFYSWHISKQARHPSVVSTPEHRLYTCLPVTEYVVAVNLTYQIWDFLVSLTIPEHCTAVMMTHHAVAAIVCWSTLSSYMLGYYSTFFLGMSEISSMFLVFLDMSRYFAPQPDSVAHLIVEKLAAPLFVACFVYYRVLLWWPISYQLYQDVKHVTKTGRANILRPGRTWVLYLQVGLDFPMGLLQLYWLTLIAKEVQAALGGSSENLQEMA
jgi:hypothetical protein